MIHEFIAGTIDRRSNNRGIEPRSGSNVNQRVGKYIIMLWIKSFHIIAMVAWFAGLFYLPRLFVYHVDARDIVGQERFKMMEYKLYRYIMTPAAWLTTGLGVWLITYAPKYYLQAGWMHTKLFLVLVLWGFHFYCGRLVRVFQRDANTHSQIFYRWFNEIPTVLLVALVILVVVKPW